MAGILLITASADVEQRLRPVLESVARGPGAVVRAGSLQEAIELLEAGQHELELIVCGHPGKGTALLKALLALAPETPCVLLTEVEDTNELILADHRSTLEFLPVDATAEELASTIHALRKRTP